ncbi:MAG: benzoate/H(+) symporter BenE family transporter [Chloroflexota bacterium]
MLRNLFDLPRSIALSSVSAGFVAMLIGCSGPLLIVVQAAQNAGLTDEQLSSWVWAVMIGTGICSLLMSLWYRQPLLAAWPTAGAALLASSLPEYSFNEAVGAYIVSSIGLILLGISGLFGRMMGYIPGTIIAGMMAGILLQFGTNVFTYLLEAPLLVVAMLAGYLLLKRFKFTAPTIGIMIVGLLICYVGGTLNVGRVSPRLTIPVLIVPAFSLQALLGLSLPLFILANASQNAPGLGVLRSFGYNVPPEGPITLTGIVSLLAAPMGNFGFSLSAITAAICVSPDAHPDPDKRYSAGVAYGLWYIIFGLFGATAVALFNGLPAAFIATLAGLSLLGAINAGLTGAMSEPTEREPALLAFLITASNITILGIGAPFWGLVVGVAAHWILGSAKARPNA